MLGEKIAVCFSIAIYNKNHLNSTERAATTDALTGVSNRVAYKNDRVVLDRERAAELTCVFIDVNELHLINNKYGHAAGDEMLLYIANTLKEVFCGHKIYRIGGDEFLIFAQGMQKEQVQECIETLMARIAPKNYHVAVGTAYRKVNTDTEEMVNEAETRMYEAKAKYYQNKEHAALTPTETQTYVSTKTGIDEIDTMLPLLKEHYIGIYRVSLATDQASCILMPVDLGYNESESNFSTLFSAYVNNNVDPDDHRAMQSFVNYEAIRAQLMQGKTPQIAFKKRGGENIILRVHKLQDTTDVPDGTLWVFEKA